MAVILVFIAFVIVGDTVAVSIASLAERISEPVSLMVFFAGFIFVFGLAWKLAVAVTEKYLVRAN